MIDHSLTYRLTSARNVVHIYRLRKIISLLKRIQSEQKGQSQIQSLCDVGCSNGYLTNIMMEKLGINDVTGLDFSDNLDVAKQNYPKISFDRLNLNDLNDNEKQYSLVTCFETLEHVGNLDHAISNLLNRTSAAGTLLISVPIEIGFWGIIKFALKKGIYNYSLDEIEANLGDYTKALLTGKRISRFRPQREGYGTHFGFDYRDIDDILATHAVNFSSFSSLTSRFYKVTK